MDEPEKPPVDVPPNRRKILSGTRALLASIVLVALGLGWLAHAQRQAERRAFLGFELARSGVHSLLDEPTYLGQIVKKFWPHRESWLRGKIGGGWLDYPSIFACVNLDDEQVPGVARRLRELGTVREVHYHGARLTEAGIAGLRGSLPGVNVVPNDSPALHRYFLASMGTHTAYGALGFMIAVATTLLGLLVVSARWLVRRLRAVRRGRPSPRWSRAPREGLRSNPPELASRRVFH